MADETTELRVRLVTPERTLFEQGADSVLLPSLSGYIEVMPGHAPLMTELGVGEVAITNAEGESRYFVGWGFAEVLPDRVTILASEAQKPEEIDVPAAEKQLDLGIEQWKHCDETLEANDAAERIMNEAEARLAVAGEKLNG
jgi:F-type H+-transporting ATPase subunit epsilon